MSTPDFTYYIEIGGVETQVYPYGDWSLKLKKAEEDFSFCKDYRIKCDGDVIFGGDDYDLIKTADCCEEMLFKIYCDNGIYWVGYFGYPNNLDFDEDRCEIKGTPGTKDKYYDFDKYADDAEQTPHNYISFTFESGNIGNDVWSAGRDYGTLLFYILDWYAGQIKVGLNAVSTFFENNLFPDATNPYPTNNYVTGYTNKLNNVVFAITKHVHTGNTVNPDYPELSWDEWMEIIHNTFNTWWYLDEAGDLRIEHIYFWELYFGTSYDLTTMDGGRWLVNTSKYRYLEESFPQRELWQWKDNLLDNTDFLEQNIGYDCSYRNEFFYEKEYILQNLTTDMEYIAQSWVGHVDTAEIEDEEYMFLRCITRAEANAPPYNRTVAAGIDYVVWYSQGARTGANHLNAHLSASNLHVNYWMHDRPFWEGTMIGSATVFESVWHSKVQDELSFPVCCIGEANEYFIDQWEMGWIPAETITTQYGDGEIYTGTIDKGMLTTELAFENDCSPGSSPTEWSGYSEL